MKGLNPTSVVSKEKAVSVTDLTKQIKTIIEGQFTHLWVLGELSNVVRHSSGHLYFTLKDASAEIKCVMFRGFSNYLPFAPENGMKTLTFGSLSVYESRGQYQLIVKQMEVAGTGSLFLALEAVKKKLREEGLFDESLKKIIPPYPKVIGIITSPTGAAIKDILDILDRRAPHVSVQVIPTKVQGEGASDEIVTALNHIEKRNDIDIIILGRGGGSLEDLWTFNEEKLARAVVRCPIPIISAVGHETDFTLVDFVADLRAPTPSAGAEMAAVSRNDILSDLERYVEILRDRIHSKIYNNFQKLDHISEKLELQDPIKKIKRYKELVSESGMKLLRRIQNNLEMKKKQLISSTETLNVLSPKGVLKRGYSLAYTIGNKTLIRQSKDISSGNKFILETGNGKFEAEKTKELNQNSNKD